LNIPATCFKWYTNFGFGCFTERQIPHKFLQYHHQRQKHGHKSYSFIAALYGHQSRLVSAQSSCCHCCRLLFFIFCVSTKAALMTSTLCCSDTPTTRNQFFIPVQKNRIFCFSFLFLFRLKAKFIVKVATAAAAAPTKTFVIRQKS